MSIYCARIYIYNVIVEMSIYRARISIYNVIVEMSIYCARILTTLFPMATTLNITERLTPSLINSANRMGPS